MRSGAGDGEGGMSTEVATWMESLVCASIGGSTHKVYAGKWSNWLEFTERNRAVGAPDGRVGGAQSVARIHGLPPILFEQSTVHCQWVLGRNTFYHKLYLGWDLPTSHCVLVATAQRADIIRGTSVKQTQVTSPITWSGVSRKKGS